MGAVMRCAMMLLGGTNCALLVVPLPISGRPTALANCLINCPARDSQVPYLIKCKTARTRANRLEASTISVQVAPETRVSAVDSGMDYENM
eukprot:1564066-Rhodomonas_salina.1